VNKEASQYVRLFGGNKIGHLIFLLPLVIYISYGLWYIIYSLLWLRGKENIAFPLWMFNFL
jgi:hypothetical protein